MILTDDYLDQLTSFYVVARGRRIGVFNHWNLAERQVSGFSGPIHERFFGKRKAVEFLFNKLTERPKTEALNADELETLASCEKLITDWPPEQHFPSLI
jgi:viroplasmin and RNaseH domain-containing protein